MFIRDSPVKAVTESVAANNMAITFFAFIVSILFKIGIVSLVDYRAFRDVYKRQRSAIATSSSTIKILLISVPPENKKPWKPTQCQSHDLIISYIR